MPVPGLVAHRDQETRDLAVTELRAALLGVVGLR